MESSGEDETECQAGAGIFSTSVQRTSGPDDVVQLSSGPEDRWSNGQADQWTGGPVDKWTWSNCPVDYKYPTLLFPLVNMFLEKVQSGRESNVCTGLLLEFGVVRLYRTFSNHIFTRKSRCVVYLYTCSGWFNRSEP